MAIQFKIYFGYVHDVTDLWLSTIAPLRIRTLDENEQEHSIRYIQI